MVRTTAPAVTKHKIRKGATLKLRGGIWYLVTCVDSIESRVTLSTGDLQTALSKAMEILNGTASAPLPRRQAKVGALTLKEALDAYKKDCAELNADGEPRIAESSQRRVFPVLQGFVDHVGGELDVRDITRKHPEGWLKNRSHCAAITLRNDLVRVRTFWTWIQNEKEITNLVSFDGVKTGKKVTIEGRPSPGMKKIHAVLQKLKDHPWLYDYCRVLLETGMRPAELLGLRSMDVRVVKDGKTEQTLVDLVSWPGRKLKNAHSNRTIPVSPVAAEILTRIKKVTFGDELPLFGTEEGKVRVEGAVYQLFRKVLGFVANDKYHDITGVPLPEELEMDLYGWRHQFCTLRAQRGPNYLPLEDLRRYVGHSPKSAATLERYYIDDRAMEIKLPGSILTEAAKVIPMRKVKR